MALSMSSELSQNRSVVLGLPLDAVSLGEAIAIIDGALAARRRLFISTPNASFYTNSRNSEAFRNSLFASDLCLADGAPVLWLASLMGVSLPGRVAGSDLFEALSVRKLEKPIRAYFFGGGEGVARAACRRVNATSQGITCVGAHYPGFGNVADMSNADTISKINRSGADLLVVAIGLVRGQEWIMRNRERIKIPVVAYLGAVINFEAGRVARAPSTLRKFGLEWLWRVKEEPTLAVRYAADLWSLMRLLFLGVVPHMVHSIIRGKSRTVGRDGVITTDWSGERARLAIIGRVDGASTLELRAAFLKALATGKSVTLACDQLSSIKPVALGQIALLWKALQERGRDLEITGLRGYPLWLVKISGFGAVVRP
ncbi:MAG TPA: WecB/TagA/CpsF family glycosyltransferase [Aestuariivirga sp.]|nr:WecB/TagA/CpsF family glycosyltransferase [Aestuariivirga sp.]